MISQDLAKQGYRGLSRIQGWAAASPSMSQN